MAIKTIVYDLTHRDKTKWTRAIGIPVGEYMAIHKEKWTEHGAFPVFGNIPADRWVIDHLPTGGVIMRADRLRDAKLIAQTVDRLCREILTIEGYDEFPDAVENLLGREFIQWMRHVSVGNTRESFEQWKETDQ